MSTTNLGYNVSLIDAFDIGKERRTGSYVLHDDDVTIIETSASPSIPYVLKGLEELGIELTEVKNIIVTHIHLDHAGGVGLLLNHCPNAKVIVHPRGKRHLADPSRLIQGAKAVYGDKFNELFDPILPVPEDRLVIKEDGEKIKIGKERMLTFMDTPGHANHHFSIHDSLSNGIFTGDTIGVYYPQVFDQGVELFLPSTSPNQFDPETMLHSMKKISSLHVERIYFGHYGMTANPDEVYKQIEYWLPIFMAAGEKVWAENPTASFDAKQKAIFLLLLDEVHQFLSNNKIVLNGDISEIIQLDLTVGSMGILDYLTKREK
ncbi:MBL fold metallo-hydrolase [Bacillus sp. DTU_2020_1000418_1_SI_GHA_SEK_038]|uniref:MBL fold metallo-hydrolase n=1 Tax=Bacillus sp. DTU_2020_1000418_1_SI_GHA_SEK_038 TaxID=3077585 RepID=UPI0028EB9F04|nr:MBL fold metallo-hydrolase [Bacillus sp. DTU_2020_1000418_1_SI_GHA_SEK_038]WNS76692.1 MBL fold metallo-hydrolase [Bacillus sp. DTU_2020_1000418_1_SI_GHA_SEK_038]